MAKIDWLRGSVERCVRSGVHCIDLCAALHQQLRHLQAGKESVLAFFEEILALQGVVPHHRQVQEGIAARRSWVDAMHDVMNSATKGDVVVAALKLRHQVQQVRDDPEDFVVGVELTAELRSDVQEGGAIGKVSNEELDSGDDILEPDLCRKKSLRVFLVEVQVQFDQGLCREARITIEYGIFVHPEFEGVLPQVDAVLVLERVCVGSSAVHESVDHVLVEGAEDSFANQETLNAESVQVEGNGFEFRSIAELADKSVLDFWRQHRFDQAELVSQI